MMSRALLGILIVGCLTPQMPAGAQAQAQAQVKVSPAANDVESDKAAIKKVILDAYVDGMFVKADAQAVRNGWHPGCDIVLFQNGNLTKAPAHNFARRFDRQPTPIDRNARAEFRAIEVSGYAAVAVLELKSGDRPVYTDMLSLYKFDDGWKIVTKVFYTYPQDASTR